MPTQRVLVFRPRTIVPAEAAGIVSRLLALSAEGERRAEDLRSLEQHLEAGWEGNARNRFLAALDTHPPGSASDASYVAQKAGEIAAIRVTVWEAVWEEVEVPN